MPKTIDRFIFSAAVMLFVCCSSTAFAVQVGGSGPTNPVSIPGSLEVNQLVVSTTIETVQGIKLGMGDSAGTMRWTGSNFEGFDGSSWKSLDVQSTSVGWTEDVPGNKVYVTDTARNVGIGTTEPATRLHVSGNAKVTGLMNAGWLSWFGTSLDSESPDALVFNNRGLTLLGGAEIPTLAGAKDLEAVGIHKTLVIVGDIPDDADAALVMANNYTDANYFYMQTLNNAGNVVVSGASVGEGGIELAQLGQYLVNTDLLTVTGTVEAGAVKLSDGHLITSLAPASIQVAFDGGGVDIAEAAILDVVVPFNCTIESVTLLAQQTGSIVVDIWKDVYDNYPPTVADTITASAKPTISSGVKSRDAVLTGWTTHLSADDIIRFKVDSCSGIENCLVILSVIRN